MTPEQKYQKIKEACQAANPALLELTFGCEIELKKPFMYEGGLSPFVITKIIDFVDGVVHYDGVYSIKTCRKDDIKEILGHEPSLADVLLAIEKSRENHIKDWFAISTSGIFLENKIKEITPRPYAHPMVSTLCSWNLLDDRLKSQSEECLNFLWNLLK